MNSFIDEYNKIVEIDCVKTMLSKKLKTNRDFLAPNRVYNKDLGGVVAPDLLTEKQFKNTIKNVYQYLGESIPSQAQLEDLYVKSFNDFTFEEFTEFMDLVQFGNFDNIQDAYKSFTKELREREIEASTRLDTIRLPPIEIDEDISIEPSIEPEFTQFYPPVGSEALYGFASSGRSEEMSVTTRDRAETERRSSENLETTGRPVSQAQIFSGERGRPRETILEGLSQSIISRE